MDVCIYHNTLIIHVCFFEIWNSVLHIKIDNFKMFVSHQKSFTFVALIIWTRLLQNILYFDRFNHISQTLDTKIYECKQNK